MQGDVVRQVAPDVKVPSNMDTAHSGGLCIVRIHSVVSRLVCMLPPGPRIGINIHNGAFPNVRPALAEQTVVFACPHVEVTGQHMHARHIMLM